MDPGHWAGRLATLAGESSVPGAVLGVWVDGRQMVTPYGVLSTRTGVATTLDSVFEIGSITKTFSATIVAQLVEEGPGVLQPRLADAGHDFEPGDASSYCNSGFVVFGRIIEVLGGRTWDESLRARLGR